MEGYIAEMRYFASNFAPRNWALCAGQLLAISTNQALFSLLGTTYGGDGRTTFGLPDCRGRQIISPGQGTNLSNYSLGEKGGVENTSLLMNNLPSHNHTVVSTSLGGNFKLPCTQDEGNTDTPQGGIYAPTPEGQTPYSSNAQVPDGVMASSPVTNIVLNASIGTSGGSQPINILNPYLAINVVICQFGIYPSRN